MVGRIVELPCRSLNECSYCSWFRGWDVNDRLVVVGKVVVVRDVVLLVSRGL